LKTRQRFAAAVFCIAFSAATLLSELFIAHETHHECSGQECPVCRILVMCHTFLNTLAGGTLLIALSAAFFRVPRSFILRNRTDYYIQTLVTLKIKISS
jgi:hypothetical protein